MTRRRRLIAQVACLGAVILAFPAAASAFCGMPIVLTPAGPSPVALSIPAGLYPFWENSDQVAHSVVFANGLCSLELAAGAAAGCDFPLLVGQYSYTVDGTTQASIEVDALPPTTVTLGGGSHTLPQSRHLRLHGSLDWSQSCGPPIVVLRVPILVLARPDRHHPFRRLTTVRSEAGTPAGGYGWGVDLHPRATTIYIARVTYRPAGEQGKRTAWSRPFKVVLRR
jgi:hypothetical protein